MSRTVSKPPLPPKKMLSQVKEAEDFHQQSAEAQTLLRAALHNTGTIKLSYQTLTRLKALVQSSKSLPMDG